ncbi:hypothetical protein HNP55_003765 [Paucibacter oligotrophus]|uniref:Gluconate 2-dehydrogenase subunit 3-like protein n=1 Tax=Roseateles oligotrophus TaxID=1769250 RepID=A0A840LG76_9BURK|nr:hypothetical protein [Roseateles oligotrophus]MBB4845218.1 hypothetical protein [Roseateles oligotrophus]
MLNRRRWLQLGLGAAVLLGVAGAGVALLKPGLVEGKLSPSARALMRAVALAVLDGQWPGPAIEREARLDQQLAQIEASVAKFPAGLRAELSQVLSLLGTAPGRLGLTGLKSDWSEASVAEIQSAFAAMSVSGIATRQQVYRALRDLHCLVFFSDATNWPRVGYPGPRAIP